MRMDFIPRRHPDVVQGAEIIFHNSRVALVTSGKDLDLQRHTSPPDSVQLLIHRLVILHNPQDSSDLIVRPRHVAAPVNRSVFIREPDQSAKSNGSQCQKHQAAYLALFEIHVLTTLISKISFFCVLPLQAEPYLQEASSLLPQAGCHLPSALQASDPAPPHNRMHVQR